MSAASLKSLMLKKIEEAKASSFFKAYILSDLVTKQGVTQEQVLEVVQQFVDSFDTKNHDTVLQPDMVAKAQFDILHQAWDNQLLIIASYQDKVHRLAYEVSGLSDMISDYLMQVVTLNIQAKASSEQADRIAQLETQLTEQKEANLKMAIARWDTA